MTQAIAQNINEILRFKERIFIIVVISIVISGFSYLYLLRNAITDVVTREGLVKESRVISTRVSELEAKYFIVKNTINIELAREKGFKDALNTSYISKKSLTAMADHNEL